MRTTLKKTVSRFYARANYYAERSTHHLLRGHIATALDYAARSKYAKHLAYEHEDTERIKFDAFMEHYGVQA
jgi:hypothetical protein